MARFRGEVGYAVRTMEKAPGVWVDEIVEKIHSGDIVRNTRRMQDGEKVNDDVFVNNSISIVANKFAVENITAIRYVKWAGALWEVDSVDVQSPRLLLRLGGVYNGPTPAAP